MYKTISEAVKHLGEAQALRDLNRGWQQRQYRKKRNMERDEMITLLKSDPEVLKQLRAKQKAS